MPWPTATLGELLQDARSGFASGQEDATGVIQVRMNNLTREGSWDLIKRRHVPATPTQLDRFALESGDVLFNLTNSPDLVGKTALLRHLDEPMVFSNHFIRLRTDRKYLDSAFLARWLQMQFGRGTFRRMCQQWVNQAAVGRDALLALHIPCHGSRSGGGSPTSSIAPMLSVPSAAKPSPTYVAAFMNSNYMKRVLRSMCKSIVGMANINAREVQSVDIPEPPAHLQNEFAGRVEAVEVRRAKHQEAEVGLDHLFASLQARAFAGQL